VRPLRHARLASKARRPFVGAAAIRILGAGLGDRFPATLFRFRRRWIRHRHRIYKKKISPLKANIKQFFLL
jgi:predicted alpha/beta hydrolase